MAFDETESDRHTGFWTWVICGFFIAVGMVFTAMKVYRSFEAQAPTSEPATLPVEAR